MKTPNAQFNDDDCAYMQTALALARRGLGQVHPNPAVGCVIVKDNHIIGRGWTGVGGRPHAETIALNNAIIGGIRCEFSGTRLAQVEISSLQINIILSEDLGLIPIFLS